MGYLDGLLDPLRLASIVVLWLSLSVHEWAHARSAYALGDDTAKAQGRMTIDPLAHLDLVGTVLLPLFGIPFGWAKPVPVNPTRFRRDVNMAYGMMLTAAAGPLANLALAVGFLWVDTALWRFAPGLAGGMLGDVVLIGITRNVVLAVFNLLPIPPLDGSRVANWLLPDSLKPAWRAVERGGLLAPFIALYAMRAIGLDPFTPALELTVRIVEALRP